MPLGKQGSISGESVADVLRWIFSDEQPMFSDPRTGENVPVSLGMVEPPGKGAFKLIRGGGKAAKAARVPVAKKAESFDDFIRQLLERQKPLAKEYDDLHWEMAKRAGHGFGGEVGTLASKADEVMAQINAIKKEILEASKQFGGEVFK